VIGAWTQLIQLDLTANLLSGTFPPEVGHLTEMRFLRVGINQFYGSLPLALSSLNKLVLIEFQVGSGWAVEPLKG
jgi:hypothetical protein